MICPYCSTTVKYDFLFSSSFSKPDEQEIASRLKYTLCPSCHELVIFMETGIIEENFPYGQDLLANKEEMIYPKKSNYLNSEGIPTEYIQDYEEALKVISVSPKASAALSRRLLQSILRDKYEIVARTLSHEIELFIKLKGIPSHLTDAVDAIRHIGNFAAHPTKDLSTGEIVSVESGEAEWLIEVIEALFDFTFIQPIKLQRRKDELNIKLEKAGKPIMK